MPSNFIIHDNLYLIGVCVVKRYIAFYTSLCTNTNI